MLKSGRFFVWPIEVRRIPCFVRWDDGDARIVGRTQVSVLASILFNIYIQATKTTRKQFGYYKTEKTYVENKLAATFYLMPYLEIIWNLIPRKPK